MFKIEYGTNYTLLPNDIGARNHKPEVPGHGREGLDHVLFDGPEDTE